MSADSFRLMILSDTHGQLPREVARACEGADHIIHAGDVGGDGILPELESMAPVTVVCGNVDRADLAPVRARLRLGGWRILVQHIVWRGGGPSGEVRDLLSGEEADLVVFGYTHEPLCRREGGTVLCNPGSCGQGRFSLPRSYAEAALSVDEGRFRIFGLAVGGAADILYDQKFPLGG